jgi:hypothetical protein
LFGRVGRAFIYLYGVVRMVVARKRGRRFQDQPYGVVVGRSRGKARVRYNLELAMHDVEDLDFANLVSLFTRNRQLHPINASEAEHRDNGPIPCSSGYANLCDKPATKPSPMLLERCRASRLTMGAIDGDKTRICEAG